MRQFGQAASREGVWWLVSIEDRNGNTVTVERDEHDTPVTATHIGGYRVHVDSEGGRITYGEPQDDGTSTVTYTDSFGHRTLYRANRRGQIFAITDPLGHTTTQQWDRHDHLLSHTDPLGRTTRWNWDATAT
ncbi:RHS repeat domain-containing protein [Streptomyces olivaceoviridis]|uniref:RHS repeat domain-containing protein n=1 Tax=Streptomyces olivaceoviridis TaxID=1921 RepID=UPI0036BC5E9C